MPSKPPQTAAAPPSVRRTSPDVATMRRPTSAPAPRAPWGAPRAAGKAAHAGDGTAAGPVLESKPQRAGGVVMPPRSRNAAAAPKRTPRYCLHVSCQL